MVIGSRSRRAESLAISGAVQEVVKQMPNVMMQEVLRQVPQRTADTHTLVQDKHASKRLKKEPQTDRSLEGCPMS